MYNHADDTVQFAATAVFSLLRRHCSVSNGAGVQWERYIHKILRDNNIPTVVWLCPVLPYINDTEDNIRRILDMCVEAKVRGIICFGTGLTLREGNREYFYRQLDKSFPGLKERYIREYGNQYVINSPKSAELMRLFHRTCEQNGIMHDNDLIFEYLSQFEEKNAPQQLSLWD